MSVQAESSISLPVLVVWIIALMMPAVIASWYLTRPRAVALAGKDLKLRRKEKIMEKLIWASLILALVVLAFTAARGCSRVEAVRGRVWVDSGHLLFGGELPPVPLARATILVSSPEMPGRIWAARSNPFGYFTVPAVPLCGQLYGLTVHAKNAVFDKAIFFDGSDGEEVWIEITGRRSALSLSPLEVIGLEGRKQ